MKLTLLQFVSYNEIDLIFCLYLKHLYFFSENKTGFNQSYFSCCSTIKKSCIEIVIVRGFFFLQNSVNMCSIGVDRARRVLIRFYFFQTNIVPIRFHCNAYILPMDERK